MVVFKYFYLSQIQFFQGTYPAIISRVFMSFPCLNNIPSIYQSPATARYALEMSPSNAVLAKGIFLEPFVYYMWGRFLPSLRKFAKNTVLDLPYIQIGSYLFFLFALRPSSLRITAIPDTLFFPPAFPFQITAKNAGKYNLPQQTDQQNHLAELV